MTPLRRMLHELQRRNYAPSTIRSYLGAVQQFAEHFHCSPERLGPEQLRRYQIFLLLEKKLEPSTVEICISALRFLYKRTLKRRDLAFDDLIFPKVPQKLPTVLSQEEVARLIDAAPNRPYRTILVLLYATGARRAEAALIKVADIDSQRMVIHIRQGKGARDRDVPVTPKLRDRTGTCDIALPLTMGHYTREDLPFYYALADAFTVCDQNYCSVMTSTSPNRSYFWTGTIRDQQSVDSKVHIRNEQIDNGRMSWKTFPERLQDAGIRWKSYQNELTRSGLAGEEDAWLSNFGDNTLECFSAYNVEAYPGYIPPAKQWISELSAQTSKLESELSAEIDPAATAKLRGRREQTRSRIKALKTSIAKGGEARYSQL